MKTYEVSIEQGKLNNSITIESTLFKNFKEARNLFNAMKKRVKENEVLYLTQYDNDDTTLADIIDFKEGE